MSNLQASAMRREPTEAERLLWSRLRDHRLGGLNDGWLSDARLSSTTVAGYRHW